MVPFFFNQDKRDTVLNMLRLGLSRKSAARYIGCHVITIYREIHRDPVFSKDVTQAEAGFEARHRSRIEKASEDPARWRASVWSLEQKYPDEYRPRPPRTVTPQQLEHVIAQFAQVLVNEIPDKALRDQTTRALWKVIEDTLYTPETENLTDEKTSHRAISAVNAD